MAFYVASSHDTPQAIELDHRWAGSVAQIRRMARGTAQAFIVRPSAPTGLLSYSRRSVTSAIRKVSNLLHSQAKNVGVDGQSALWAGNKAPARKTCLELYSRTRIKKTRFYNFTRLPLENPFSLFLSMMRG